VKKIDRLTCEETFRRLDDYLDRELDQDEMALVRKHLKACEVCESEYVFEDTVFTAVREKLQRVPLPDGLKERVFDRLEEMRRTDA
jgi:anti-sigma factor (TIGR02949 family)